MPHQLRGLTIGELFHERFGLTLSWVVFEENGLEAALRRSAETGRPLVIYHHVQHFHQNATTVFTIETSQLLVVICNN